MKSAADIRELLKWFTDVLERAEKEHKPAKQDIRELKATIWALKWVLGDDKE